LDFRWVDWHMLAATTANRASSATNLAQHRGLSLVAFGLTERFPEGETRIATGHLHRSRV
jgi:hypothetical protein